MGRLIRTFLVNDDPDGLKTLEISNLTIKATVFPRPLLRDFLAREDAKRPGVYLLYGNAADEDTKLTLYIGEGDPVSERFKRHSISKDFWTNACVFTSKDEYLTKTQIKYLESNLIELAKQAKRVTLDNINDSNSPTISEVDKAETGQFLEATLLLSKTLNINFFQPLSYSSINPTEGETVYEFKIKTFLGKMAIREGKYVLLAGSTASKAFRQSATDGMKRYRQTLIADGALEEGVNPDELIVRKDIPCGSCSRAAEVISGGSERGPKVWKYAGKTLDEIEQQSADEIADE